jgi:hypothetical protein
MEDKEVNCRDCFYWKLRVRERMGKRIEQGHCIYTPKKMFSCGDYVVTSPDFGCKFFKLKIKE